MIRLKVNNNISERIDVWLLAELPDYGLSRSFVRKLIDDGCVLRNGKPVKPSYKPAADDIIEVTLPDFTSPADILPENIPLEIKHEDNDIIIINKPQGMVVHPSPGHFSGTLVNALLHHCKDNLSGINGVLRPGIVHRLDRDTSGLMVVAKNDTAHRSLAAQLAARTVERCYNAVAMGKINEPITVNQPIARHKIHRKKMTVDPAGREAITHFKPIKVYDKYTHVEARLVTGRTHQIRVHLAYLKRPVMNDALYNVGATCGRPHLLHSLELGFVHPTSNNHVTFTSPLPDYFYDL